MNTTIAYIAYYAVLTLGIAGLIASVILAGYGIIRLYAWVLERYLAAKKLRELFRDFMFEQARQEIAEKRKARR